MWQYAIVFNRKAQKELEKLPFSTRVKIIAQIEILQENPFPNWCKKIKNFYLTWFEGTSLYRLRVGNYRVVYSIQNNELKIEIIRISHRKDVYSNH